ncbi:hypothetical protein JZN58_004103 [Vibrio vulnificus]|nr:hypothetical protein [Vibrio vulnificus]
MTEFCSQCSKHKNERRPTSPKKLAEVVDMITQCIANEELSEEPLINQPYYTSFDSIKTSSWPDIIWCVFKCSACGKLFELNAMTYVGAGNNRFGEQLEKYS